MAINGNSPIDFQFQRNGGADIQAEVQIWPKKDKYSPTDRPLARLQFSNPLVAHEGISKPLANGTYICVLLGIVRESLNGVYSLVLTIEGNKAYAQQGDVNTTPQPGDLINFRADIELVVI